MTAIIGEFIRGIRVRTKKSDESILTSLQIMVSQNRSRYGGYIVHIGIVCMFIGFTGQAFNQEKEFGIIPGEKEHLGGFDFELKQVKKLERPNHLAWIAELRVTDLHGEFITNLLPEKRIYFHKSSDENRRQAHSELDIFSRFNKDIYSIFNAVDESTNTAFLKIMINPLVRWVWVGGCVLAIGALVAFNPKSRKK